MQKKFLLQINSKYSEDHAHEVLEWIKEITNEEFSTSGEMDNLYEVLKDGTMLCKYVTPIRQVIYILKLLLLVTHKPDS